MTATRLSPLDDSFLAAESPTAHMHVGWAAVFEPRRRGRRPSFEQLRDHIGRRLRRAPRYRQRMIAAPFGLDVPSWVDDEDFDIGRHVIRSRSRNLDHVVAECMSQPLERDRPLWEICIADNLQDGRLGLIGKVHHAMVDGIAAVELASLLLDPGPEPPEEPLDDWLPAPAPGPATRLGHGAVERTRDQLETAREAIRFLGSPRRLAGMRAATGDTLKTVRNALRPSRPVTPLNEKISTRRGLARVQRPLADLQRIKRAFEATVNDVYLAIAAGAVRRLLIDQGTKPRPLKTMVPVNVREDGELEQLGNRISFMFIELPCDEPDPGLRLKRIQAETASAKGGGEPAAADSVLKLLGRAPRRFQRLASRIITSPRMFNLTVSNIPGPPEPMYMLGSELKEAYPVVPIPERHALSIGMTTIQDRACFGVYADRSCISDIRGLEEAVERSSDDLLAVA